MSIGNYTYLYIGIPYLVIGVYLANIYHPHRVSSLTQEMIREIGAGSKNTEFGFILINMLSMRKIWVLPPRLSNPSCAT